MEKKSFENEKPERHKTQTNKIKNQETSHSNLMHTHVFTQLLGNHAAFAVAEVAQRLPRRVRITVGEPADFKIPSALPQFVRNNFFHFKCSRLQSRLGNRRNLWPSKELFVFVVTLQILD